MRTPEVGTQRQASGPRQRAGTASRSPTRRTWWATRSSPSPSPPRPPSTLRFATGVTNAHTRHPAALATVAATVQETSGGRFVLGIGRGDTALFHLGLQAHAGGPVRRR